MAYRHTQIGWAMIAIFGGIIAFGAWILLRTGGTASTVGTIVIAVMVACLFLFISQTVIVDAERLQLRMGPGLIRRTVPLQDILDVGRLRLPWWAVTYGIRMSLSGKAQLWRVSGAETVDLQLSGERRLLITSDEADVLAAAIRAAVEARAR